MKELVEVSFKTLQELFIPECSPVGFPWGKLGGLSLDDRGGLFDSNPAA